MPDMSNVVDSLYTFGLSQLNATFTDSDANKCGIEHNLDGGRQLNCVHCGTKKSYSGSSQKLIAEAFHDSGWNVACIGSFHDVCCPECAAKEPEIGYAKLLATSYQPQEVKLKSRYVYGGTLSAEALSKAVVLCKELRAADREKVQNEHR